eukprot:CAMPEP_0198108018 /NCGR_PEP_ID=MMETSP1442-20131203/108_1 /TAXON_ID= /ORGANISM="Craspedostauros australis, Strain CCMP3328" /LENGTH=225 /DNA_ID=CAMNT_0043763205 /DNA_START=294 /DNA_END=971 /DNA_ORIENTATION=-
MNSEMHLLKPGSMAGPEPTPRQAPLAESAATRTQMREAPQTAEAQHPSYAPHISALSMQRLQFALFIKVLLNQINETGNTALTREIKALVSTSVSWSLRHSKELKAQRGMSMEEVISICIRPWVGELHWHQARESTRQILMKKRRQSRSRSRRNVQQQKQQQQQQPQQHVSPKHEQEAEEEPLSRNRAEAVGMLPSHPLVMQRSPREHQILQALHRIERSKEATI